MSNVILGLAVLLMVISALRSWWLCNIVEELVALIVEEEPIEREY